ncbi:MAG: hypothetical protein BWK77_04625 [Verrucomicrobia bacterium A1]|nr:MAG: hypothetical protein BWK77_04625 [Verrucomicrobia bacterium A1]
MNPSSDSGSSTAKRAAEMLEERNEGFIVPTAQQRQNMLVAFAKKGKVVYGKAFDIVRLSAHVNLDELGDVERNLEKILVFEIKSTRKDLPPDFSGYFFGLSAAEVLVAQSLRDYFKFIFVNVNTGQYIEMGLGDIFARAKGIYPTWSIMF